MDRPSRLDVYYGSELVGTIHDASSVAFEYATGWLERAERMAVAAIALEPVTTTAMRRTCRSVTSPARA